MEIANARKLLWEIAENLTDEEVLDLINQWKKFAISIVDFAEEKAW